MAFILLLVGLACLVGPESPLAGTSWTLAATGAGDNLREVSATSPVTLEFLDNDYELQGLTECNAYSSTYQMKDDSFRVFEVRITEAGCPTRELSDHEDEYTDILIDAHSATIDGSRLMIDDRSGRVLIFDRRM